MLFVHHTQWILPPELGRNCSDPSLNALVPLSKMFPWQANNSEGNPAMASAKATFRLLSLTLITFVGWSLVNAQSLTLGLKGGLFYLVSTESASSGRDIYLSHESGFGFGPWEPWVDMECRYKPLRGLVTFAADASYSWLKGDGNYYRVSASGNGSGGPEFRGDLYVV